LNSYYSIIYDFIVFVDFTQENSRNSAKSVARTDAGLTAVESSVYGDLSNYQLMTYNTLLNCL